MKYRLLNLLACPHCKNFPLDIIIIEVKEYERKLPSEPPLCDLYCGYLGKYLKELNTKPPCAECIKKEIVTAVIYCRNCKRWYPVIDEIPRMLPDHYRNRGEDINFLKKYSDKIPDEIKYHGKPFNLSS